MYCSVDFSEEFQRWKFMKTQIDDKTSESEGHQKDAGILSVEDFVRKIKDYDVISFDIFDTLIFRPFSSPTDVFYLIGEKFDFLDFKNLRVWAEWDARMKCRQKTDIRKCRYRIYGKIWRKIPA